MDGVAGTSKRKIGSAMGVDMDGVAGPSKRKIVSEMGVDANSSTSLVGGEYEVFLSFRGPDTRYDFTDFLYKTLDGKGVRTFRDDDELRKGGEIGSALLKAIEESRISIPIFSKDYASSKWCLNELVKMVECKRSNGQLILPIFYHVEPSDVRHQSGCYEEAFQKHETLFPDSTVKQWKEALREAGALKGWEVEKATNGYQGELITDKIVPTVLLELKKNYMVVDDMNLVGIHDHINEMMRRLDVVVSNKVQIVGILGMGGIGKTTIAKIIYNKLFESFNCCSFLADVRETAQQHNGLISLQKKLLTETLNRCPNIVDVNSGLNMIKERFLRKKVLIVLDDVNEKFQFNWLVGNRKWFGSGSRIIVTTRDKHILNALEVDETYEPPCMNSAQSLKLFSMHAFRQMFPPKDYDNISRKIACSAGGLPLALEVMGSFLFDKKKLVVWEDALKMLEETPHDKVEKMLRISYDSLNCHQKQIFLDIACHFSGMDKATLFYMWDDCGYHPNIEFDVLCLMSLVKEGDANEVMMHDQLKALGRKIVCEETSLGKRSRLWNHEEALAMLKGRRGTDQVETLSLGFVKYKRNMEMHRFTNEEFAKLENLRYLEVDSIDIDGDFKFLLSSLRWLCWHQCPQHFRATNFCVETLVILDLSDSDITEDWAGWSQIKMGNKLKVLNLAKCDLRRTIDFSSYPNLEILNLQGKFTESKLVEIDPSIGNLKNLKVINISWSKVRKLPNEIWTLEKLEVIDASHCFRLEGDIPSIMGKLSSLRFVDFYCTKVQSLLQPTNILELTRLQYLNLVSRNLKMLPELPSCLKTLHVSCIPNLADLVNLQEFHLEYCNENVEISRDIGKLSKLEKMSLAKVNIRTLPKEIGALSQLKFLSLYSCEYLQSILGIPSSVVDLYIGSCKSLEILADLSSLSNLLKLEIWICPNLTEVKGLGELGSLTNLEISLVSISTLPKEIGALSQLKFLELDSCDYLQSILGLPSSLVHLSIEKCKSLEILADLSSLSNLLELNISWCRKLTEVQGLRELGSLTSLEITGCDKLVNINMPQQMASLPSWEMMSERKYLERKANLSNLKSLAISDCPEVDNIQGLDKLESLEDLSLRWCRSIVNLPNLSNLKMLRFLQLYKCINLQEIKGLEAMESLKELRVSGCPVQENIPDLPNTRVVFVDEEFETSSDEELETSSDEEFETSSEDEM